MPDGYLNVHSDIVDFLQEEECAPNHVGDAEFAGCLAVDTAYPPAGLFGALAGPLREGQYCSFFLWHGIQRRLPPVIGITL